MFTPANSTDLRLLLPEVILLESSHFESAKKMSDRVNNESHRWQTYLNSLALLGFESWLNARTPKQPIIREPNFSETVSYLKVGDFKVCLIAIENILDEEVILPIDVIEKPELAAHFYVVIEVLEEEEELIIRGFMRHDELSNYLKKLNFSKAKIPGDSKMEMQLNQGFYRLPLSLFDPEPNHLLFYSRFLEATAIPLPAVTANKVETLVEYLQESTTKLSQWLQGVIDESWLAIDAFVSPEAQLAFSTRSVEVATKRAKLIDLGIELNHQNVALLVQIAEETEDKISISAQLHPTGRQKYLPANIKLILLSKAGKNLQEVEARGQDNYIQLKLFKGEKGKRFSIEVSLGDVNVRENFEL